MTLIIAMLLAPFAALTFAFAVEIFAGLWPLQEKLSPTQLGTRAVIIVPAHDEEPVIQRCLDQLRAAAEDNAEILVVADNCTDGTAEIARASGFTVIERSDPDRRGKGFALDFARNHLSADPPSIVLVVDADCEIDSFSVKRLVQACCGSDRPCQGTNLQRPSPDAPPTVQLSTFAFFIKNVIRQRALQRIAGRAHLLGTGMAIPWQQFASADLATNSIVEDLKLGLELGAAGFPAVFIESAFIWSKAETKLNTLSQRQRWEGGFLLNAVRVGPRMLWSGLASVDARLLATAVDIMIPPFALLLMLDVVALLIGLLVTWAVGAQTWPVLVQFASMVLAVLGVAAVWIEGGSRFVGLGALARAPLYLLWKVPLYLKLVGRGAPKEWRRTERS